MKCLDFVLKMLDFAAAVVPTEEELAAEAEKTTSCEPEDFEPQRGHKSIEEFEKEMADYLAAKNDASLMNSDLYFQRSFWRGNPNIQPKEPEPEPEQVPAVREKKATKARWKGVAAKIVEAERSKGGGRHHAHGKSSSGKRSGKSTKSGRRRSSECERKMGEEDSAGSDDDGSEDGDSIAALTGKDQKKGTAGRVVELDENYNAVWGKGRGTTRLTFTVDDEVDTRRYVFDAVCFVYTCRRLIDLALIAGTTLKLEGQRLLCLCFLGVTALFWCR